MVTSKDNIVYGGDPVNANNVTQNYKSFGQYALDKLKSHGNTELMIDGLNGQKYTANVIYDHVIRLVNSFQRLNIKEGDVVGLCSENRFEFVVVTFATLCINATVATFNVTYTERELHHAVNLSKPKLFFTSPYSIEKINDIAKKNKFIKKVFVFADSSPVKGISTFSQLINNVKSAKEYIPKGVNMQENVGLIVCSSGTTGLPKGVQLTQKNIMSTIDRSQDNTTFSLEGVAVLTVIPWFHSFGLLSMIMSICMGTVIVFLPKFEERAFLSAIEKHKVMVAFMVPPLMVFLAKHPLVDSYDLSSLVALLCGAAPLSKETEDAIKKRIGVSVIFQGYGLSESTLSVLVQSEEKCKPGSVGTIKAGMYAKVIDPETGKALGPNERGELCFKGDCIMKGYIGDNKSTQTAIKDGWLHTGDIGYYDTDFEFFIVDRIKELIKYKAFQVPPAEIESLLLTNSKIKDAAVIGLPDEESGELPMAFVVKQPNVELTDKEVIDYIAERASPAKRLRGGVKFIDEIPKNPSGKILRRVLKDMLKTPKSKL